MKLKEGQLLPTYQLTFIALVTQMRQIFMQTLAIVI